GMTRTFQSFTQAAAEAGMSRIYGGIHWRFDNADALTSCSSLGAYVFEHCFAPALKPLGLALEANPAMTPTDSTARAGFNYFSLSRTIENYCNECDHSSSFMHRWKTRQHQALFALDFTYLAIWTGGAVAWMQN